MKFVELLERYRDRTLTTENRGQLWLEVSRFTQKTARSHYGTPQSRGFRYKAGGVQKVGSNPLAAKVVDDDKYEKYMLRMVRFFDFFDAYPERPPKWILFVWRRRYAWIEQVMEAELLGVGVYPDDLPFHKRVTHNITKKLVECKALMREMHLQPTDFMKLEEPLNERHTKKYTRVSLSIFGGFVRAAYPWLFAEEYNKQSHRDSGT